MVHQAVPLFIDRPVKPVEPGPDLTTAMPWKRTSSTAASAAQSFVVLQVAWLMFRHASHCLMCVRMIQVYLSRIDSNENPLVHQGILESYPSITGQNREYNRDKTAGYTRHVAVAVLGNHRPAVSPGFFPGSRVDPLCPGAWAVKGPR